MHFRALAAAAALAALLPAAATAQSFPSKSVHILVGYAAGGTGDIVARIVAEKLSLALGQNVVVENRSGGSGAVATQAVAVAPPDGHTLLMGQPAEVAINQHFGKLNYDPEKDLTAVTLATVVPLALVVPGSTPHADLRAMLRGASAKGISFASAGTGTPGHFAGELLKLKTKTNMTHVPYRGAGPALNDLLGSHVDMFFSGFPAAHPHVQSGKLKLFAVSTAKRTAAAPDTPTVAEAAGIDFDISLWQGFFAPSRTPKEIVDKLNAEIVKILKDPEVKSKLMAAGADVAAMPVDQSTAFVKAEIGKFQAIVKEAGIKAE
jgi:tripartite-type tricarboxylate transporter receptor subunit TctC